MLRVLIGKLGFWTAALALLMVNVARAEDGQPLHVRIDRLIETGHPGPEAPPCSDAAFLRRVSLDLTGRIPSKQAAQAFLDDKSPDKRARLVKKLLGTEDYVRHMAGVFDVMLMERRGDKYVKSPEWEEYLRTSVRENRPYNELARQILGADGTQNHAAAKFYLDRDVEAHLLTRDIGRVFFGKDMECAQCHNHPQIDDYLQNDYYGIFAFVNRSYLFRPDKKKPALLAEKAEGDVKFSSAFTGIEDRTRPRLPGQGEITEPAVEVAYKVKPDPKKKNVRPIPTYSRREKLAEVATNGSNEAFNKNIANRLWAHMMGRGLVDPVDLHHRDNPPSHPEVLDLLAREFVAMNFDVKAFLEQLALTKAYQRSFDFGDQITQQVAAAKAELPKLEKRLAEEKPKESALEDAFYDIDEEVTAARDAAQALEKPLKDAQAAAEKARKADDANTKAHAEAQKKLAEAKQLKGKLADALAATEKVAELVPEDKSVTAAAKTLETRVKTTTAQVAKLQKDAEAKAKAAAATKTARERTEKALAEVQSKMDAAQKKLTEARDKLVAHRVRWEDKEVEIAEIEARIQSIKQLEAYAAEAPQYNTLLAEATKLQQQQQALQQSFTDTEQALKATQSELAAAEKAHGEAEAALKSAETTVAACIEADQLLDEATAKAEAALAKVKDDSGMAEVVKTLKTVEGEREDATKAAQEALTKRQAALKTEAGRMSDLSGKLADLTKKRDAAKKALAEKQPAVDAALAKLEAAEQQFNEVNDALVESWTDRFALATLEPLSPEQLAWSILQATGMIEVQRAAAEAELNKKNPLTEEQKKDPAALAQREREIDEAAYNKLKGNVKKFVSLFAAGAGQPQHVFFATVDQALFFSNGGEIRSWLAPRSGNLTDRMSKLEDPAAIAEDLYLTVLTRKPTKSETKAVADYLNTRGKEAKRDAVQELAWALITSNEFRFQH